MKTIFLAITITLGLCSAVLADTTNTLTVVFTTQEAVTMTNAWRLNNYVRTNAGLPAINLRQFVETNAAPGILQRVTEAMDGQMEAELLAKFRASDTDKRIEILKQALRP